MQALLRKMREERADGDRGFTLIELLVVVVIIGVLVAIAVPTYLNYRKGAENKSAQSDVRSAITAVEQFYSDNNALPATGDNVGNAGKSVIFGTGSTGVSGGGGTTQTIGTSANNTISYKNNAPTYRICGVNSSGGEVYIYDSGAGGSVHPATNQTIAGCIASG